MPKGIKGFQKGVTPWNKGKYYSKELKNKLSSVHKGKKLSTETKRKISETSKGKCIPGKVRDKMSESKKGKKNPMFGKHFSLEHRKKWKENYKGSLGKHWKLTEESKLKMRIAHKGKHTGEKSNFWKGGIAPKNKKIRNGLEFRSWREKVFKRDNYTCQKTKIKGGELHPHHIKNFAKYPELRFEVSNGITLSKKAHEEFHKIYGVRDNTREQLEEFLNNLTV